MATNTKIAILLTATDKMSAAVGKAISKTQAGLSKLASKSNAIAGKAFDFGAGAGAVGLGGAALLAGPLKAFADLEKMQVALKTSFQGNERAANAAFKMINKFAASTPYEMEEVMASFVKLKNMGLDPSIESLTAYGNTASAMGKSLNDMIEAVADAATGEFERLKEFGIRSSKQGDTVAFTFQGVTTKVKMNSKAIEGYLKKLGMTKFGGGIEAQSKTLYGRFSTLKDNVKMAAASLGKTMLPYVVKLLDKLGPLIAKVERWIKANPVLTKQILIGVAAFSALSIGVAGLSFLFGGAMKAVGLYTSVLGLATRATNLMGITSTKTSKAMRLLMANGVILVAVAAVALVILIIKHWSKITAFFRRLWAGVKQVFFSALNIVKKYLLNFTPVGLIIKYWGPITNFFTSIWDKIKSVFKGAVSFLFGLGKSFWEAGKNIAMMIYKGIKSAIMMPVNAVKDMARRVRRFLPFSPAKEGALKDLNKIKLVETIAATISPRPLLKAMGNTMNALASFTMGRGSTPRPAAAGGSFNFTYAPVINGASGDIRDVLQKHGREMYKMMQEEIRKRERTKF